MYTTQVNSTCTARADWLAKKNKMAYCRYSFTNKVTLWAAGYSACVVYTKTSSNQRLGVRSVVPVKIRVRC